MIQKFEFHHYANSAESVHERNYKALKADAFIFKKTILKMLPDSLFYHHRFKSLELVNGEIRITQRLKETPLFSISVEEALLIGNDTEILY